jgi:hypothetical protein
MVQRHNQGYAHQDFYPFDECTVRTIGAIDQAIAQESKP